MRTYLWMFGKNGLGKVMARVSTERPVSAGPRKAFPPRPVAEPETVEKAHARLAERFKQTLSTLAK